MRRARPARGKRNARRSRDNLVCSFQLCTASTLTFWQEISPLLQRHICVDILLFENAKVAKLTLLL